MSDDADTTERGLKLYYLKRSVKLAAIFGTAQQSLMPSIKMYPAYALSRRLALGTARTNRLFSWCTISRVSHTPAGYYC